MRRRLRELFGLPPLPPRTGPAVPPRPRIEVLVGPVVPGALVRLALPVLVAVGALLGRAPGPWWTVVVIVAVAVTWWPRPQVTAPYVLLIGLWLLADDDRLLADSTLWTVALLVAVSHLLLTGAALAEHVAWSARVEGAALLRFARSVLGAQAVVQSLLLFVAWVRASLAGQVSIELFRVTAVIAVAVIALLVLPRRWIARRRRDVGSSPGW